MASSPYKISSKSINRFKSFTHLRILNVRHCGMAEATRLEMWHRGHPEWHHPSTKFHENPTIGSKAISGGLTDTNTSTDRLVFL
jgi:hypothetical protein